MEIRGKSTSFVNFKKKKKKKKRGGGGGGGIP